MRRLLTLVSMLAAFLLAAPVVSAATAGDEPSSAIAVSAGTSRFDSTAMTESSNDPASCGDFHDFSNTMWFSYAPSRKGVNLVDVNSFVSDDGSTDFLAIAFVYAVRDGSLQLVGCGAYPATVVFNADPNTTYLIMVAGLSAADTGDPDLSDRGGTFDLAVVPIQGRVITNRFRDASSFVDEGLSQECGFDVAISYDTRIMDKTFVSTAGVRMFTDFVRDTTTFSANGHTLTFASARTFFDRLDGNIGWVGLPIKVTLDGGMITRDAGRIVVGPDGDVVFEGGPHPFFYEGVDLCRLLAG